jgi:hypothetical protein
VAATSFLINERPGLRRFPRDRQFHFNMNDRKGQETISEPRTFFRFGIAKRT